MRRILVLGSGGAGKTVLARQLSDVLGIPVVHLDELYYDPDWQVRPAEEFVAAQRHALTAEKVILDGNYAATLPVRLAVADTVVLLDRVTVGFVRYVIDYRRRMLPRVLAMLAEHPDLSVVRLTSRRQARRFLRSLRAAAGGRAGPDAVPQP